MLQPLRTNQSRERSATIKSLPAPVGGWNARDPISGMKKTDALILDNLFPMTSEVVLRDGSANHLTGGSDEVYSLMAYHGQAGTNKLFAASGTAIYDATSAGTSWPAAAVSSTTNAKWQHVQVGTAAGQFLICCNGAVNPRRFDGSSWVDMDNTVLTGSADQTTFIHVSHFKTFVFFVQNNSMAAWYLPAGSVGGAEVKLDLGGVFTLGGYLMAMATWTLDAGAGVDDHAVFITSKGEVAVYKGTDPANASTWALVGVWRLAPPIGRRCFIKLGGDLVVLTTDGFFPLSRALISDSRIDTAISDKIRNAVAETVRSYGSNYGWQPVYFPDAPALLVNVPIATGLSHQYVMNTITGAWCRFKSWDANCWELFNGSLYYGGTGLVRKAWTGQADITANIEASAKTAFHTFDTPFLKDFKQARPIYQTDGAPGILAGLDIDFRDVEPTGVVSPTNNASATWNGTTWNGGTWQGSLQATAKWLNVSGLGNYAAFRMRIATKSSRFRWSATDVTFETSRTWL